MISILACIIHRCQVPFQRAHHIGIYHFARYLAAAALAALEASDTGAAVVNMLAHLLYTEVTWEDSHSTADITTAATAEFHLHGLGAL
mgnify:FL=1